MTAGEDSRSRRRDLELDHGRSAQERGRSTKVKAAA